MTHCTRSARLSMCSAAAGALALLTLAPPAFAQPAWYVAPAILFTQPEQRAYDDTDLSLGLSAGRVLPGNSLRLELEYTALRLAPANRGGIVDQKSLLASAYWDFRPQAAFSPYVGAGLGAARIDFDRISTRPLATLSGGIAWRLLAPRLWLDGEWRSRALYDDDETLGQDLLTDAQVLVKLRYHFGRASGADPIEPSQGRSLPATIETRPLQMESDSDGDNVPDARDRCPNTIPNVEVDADGCMVAH